MAIWIALFRGINVGGRNTLPMKELKAILEANGCAEVRTYIQSGNVVFQGTKAAAKKLPGRVEEAVEATRGFRPKSIVLGTAELERAVASNPFPEAQAEPKSVHLYFMERPPKRPDLDGMHAIKAGTESFAIVNKVLYVHAPDGIGRSKLAARAEKLLGVDTTARNWRTVSKVLELAKESR